MENVRPEAEAASDIDRLARAILEIAAQQKVLNDKFSDLVKVLAPIARAQEAWFVTFRIKYEEAKEKVVAFFEQRCREHEDLMLRLSLGDELALRRKHEAGEISDQEFEAALAKVLEDRKQKWAWPEDIVALTCEPTVQKDAVATEAAPDERKVG